MLEMFVICMCAAWTRGFLAADRRQNNLSVQSTDTHWPGPVTGSQASGSVLGSKVQTRFHLCHV